MERQRALYRHGFGILTIALSMGAVVGAMGGTPQARLWLGAHTTGIMVGLIVIAVGAIWPRLTLSERLSTLTYRVTAVGNWTGLAVLGIFAPATQFPSPISTPTLPPPAPWAGAVVGTGLLVVTLSTFVMCGLVLYGLRPTQEPAPVS